MQARKQAPTAAEMIPLSQFVAKSQGDVAKAEALTNTFLDAMPPEEHYFPKSTYVANEYKEKQQRGDARAAGAISTFFQRATQRAFALGRDFALLKQLYGILPEDMDTNMQIFLYSHAAEYHFSKIGNCSVRASYAAIMLHQLFKGAKIVVELQSVPSRDHFVVMLGNKAIGYYVYDPLTNPHVVFDTKFYQANVLNTFRKPPYTAQAMKLRITDELVATYEKQLPQIVAIMTELTNTALETVAEIKHDAAYLICLNDNGISKKDHERYIQIGADYAKSITQSESPALRVT